MKKIKIKVKPIIKNEAKCDIKVSKTHYKNERETHKKEWETNYKKWFRCIL
jgi:hypothetical protein